MSVAEEPANADATDDSGCTTWSDAALARAVMRQSTTAYAELYRRHRPAVLSVARMFLGGGPGCDDVVAEVFLALWRSPQSFDPERGPLLGFLRLNARSRSIDLLRADASRMRREQRDLSRAWAPEPAVDSSVLASELATQVRKAVASLPPGEGDVIRLAFFHGMSYRAVAAELNVAEGTVKSRIRSGLRRLSLSGDVRVHRDVPSPVAAARITPIRRRQVVGKLGPH